MVLDPAEFDRAALSALIADHLASDDGPVSRMGFFCAPFRAGPGPFVGRIIKVYQGLRDRDEIERLLRAHDEYVAALTGHGVPMPVTAITTVELDGLPVPVVVQEGLPDDAMMRPQMIAADRAGALRLMQDAGAVIARFWHGVQDDKRRIGFHPSIRNFANIDGQAIFFDTFPPLIGYSRAEMGRMLHRFSDKRLIRLIGPLMPGRIASIQDEWYDPAETLVGLVGSACRLRPADAEAFLEWGRDFARAEMAPWAEAALAGMQEPPRLPGYWTTFRRILGLQGEPNL